MKSLLVVGLLFMAQMASADAGSSYVPCSGVTSAFVTGKVTRISHNDPNDIPGGMVPRTGFIFSDISDASYVMSPSCPLPKQEVINQEVSIDDNVDLKDGDTVTGILMKSRGGGLQFR